VRKVTNLGRNGTQDEQGAPNGWHGGIGNRANCVRIAVLNRDERGDLTHVGATPADEGGKYQ
jgi:hypothetical protein